MGPVVAALHEVGCTAATLVPAGLLGLLPLHAAWTEDAAAPAGRRYALDEVRLTCAPSARSLAAARAGVARPAASLLAVDNPDGTLRFSSDEVNTAASHFPPPQTLLLAGAAAGKDRVEQALAGYDVLHFSTHGAAGWNQPLAGELLLAGGASLTVAELLARPPIRARLAVLSACETGVPGADLPDEVTGLPAAFLQAGAAGVIGSLWAVNDPSTMMLMARFYDLWREHDLPPAQALRQAQQWLRDSTNGEKRALFEQKIPGFLAEGPDIPAGERTSPQAAYTGFWQVVFAEPEERSFARPYHWAAFGYSGA